MYKFQKKFKKHNPDAIVPDNKPENIDQNSNSTATESQTGDHSQRTLWNTLLLASLAGFLEVLGRRRKKDSK